MKKETAKREADLIVGYTDENPMGHPIYDPVIFKMAFLGAFIFGVVFGVISFLIAKGYWLLQDFGQFSASQDWVSAILGAGIGIALGGLAGGLVGLKIMRKHP